MKRKGGLRAAEVHKFAEAKCSGRRDVGLGRNVGTKVHLARGRERDEVNLPIRLEGEDTAVRLRSTVV